MAATTPPTRMLAEFYAGLELSHVPAEIRKEALRVLLDTVGCALGGARGPVGKVCQTSARAFGTADAASAVGIREKVPVLAAAYVNARTANAMDFDETYPVGAHFGAAAFAGALAVAERHGADAETFLAGLIAGYELGARVATAIGPMVTQKRPGEFGYPDVWGAGGPVIMAAAGAAARARKLDPETSQQAYGLAASLTPIPTGQRWSSATSLPNCKYVDSGWCTHAGVFAVELASNGGTGYSDLFDDDLGFFAMVGAPQAERGRLLQGLGEHWNLSDVTYKRWPSCRWTHYPLTALARILADRRINPVQVERVEVLTNPLAFSERFCKSAPRDYVERQYSLPHLVSVMLHDVPAEKWLDDDIAAREDVAALRERVTCHLHPRSAQLDRRLESGLLTRIPGGIRLYTGGHEIEAHSDLALGDPWSADTRLDDHSLAEKFRRLAGALDDELAEILMTVAPEPPEPARIGQALRTIAIAEEATR